MNSPNYDHLEKIRDDIRDEIKRRIDQRDKYSIQLTVVLSAIVGVSFSKPGFEKILLAAPLASIYFTVLILYSYRIHAVLAGYLREKIEPALAALAGTDPSIEWERYYLDHAVPGIRRGFFLTALWVVTIVSLLLLRVRVPDQGFLPILIGAGTLYLLACLLVWYKLGRGADARLAATATT